MGIFGYEFIFRKKAKPIHLVFKYVEPKPFRIEKTIKDGYFRTTLYHKDSFVEWWVRRLPTTQQEIDSDLEKANKIIESTEQLKY